MRFVNPFSDENGMIQRTPSGLSNRSLYWLTMSRNVMYCQRSSAKSGHREQNNNVSCFGDDRIPNLTFQEELDAT